VKARRTGRYGQEYQQPPDTPNPGSPEAREQGCQCPVIENHHGDGFPGIGSDGQWARFFVFNMDCPLHGGGEWKDVP
jgi:hypothetical protein